MKILKIVFFITMFLFAGAFIYAQGETSDPEAGFVFLFGIGGLEIGWSQILNGILFIAAAVFGAKFGLGKIKLGKIVNLFTQVVEAGGAFRDVSKHVVDSLNDENTPNQMDPEESKEFTVKWDTFKDELDDIPVAFKELIGKELPV